LYQADTLGVLGAIEKQQSSIASHGASDDENSSISSLNHPKPGAGGLAVRGIAGTSLPDYSDTETDYSQQQPPSERVYSANSKQSATGTPNSSAKLNSNSNQNTTSLPSITNNMNNNISNSSLKSFNAAEYTASNKSLASNSNISSSKNT
jgi:hypothetical protein